MPIDSIYLRVPNIRYIIKLFLKSVVFHRQSSFINMGRK